jgi:uncharacterized SAM-binding protein YcdF (DUF218 family)
VDTVASWVKVVLVPGTTWFLLVAATAATLLLAVERTARFGRRLLAAIVVLYWLMSVPVIAYALQSTQRSKFESITTLPLPNEPLPIVVVGNGLIGFKAAGERLEIPLERTATNTLFAVARYRKTPGAVVIASGGPQPESGGSAEAEVIRDGLTRNGVPSDRILLDTRSSNTHEQAIEVARLLAARSEKRCVLVTSPQQMGRALELFGARASTRCRCRRLPKPGRRPIAAIGGNGLCRHPRRAPSAATSSTNGWRGRIIECAGGCNLTSFIALISRRREALTRATRLMARDGRFIVYGTTIPFHFVPDAGVAAQHLDTFRTSAVRMFGEGHHVSGPDFVSNVWLFAPFGCFGVWALRRPRSPVMRAVVLTVLGCILSGGVEALQLFTTDRVSSISDIIGNTAGTAIGAVGGIALRTTAATC